jgi:acyl phosphate:glycerol-3-phosphate acyltransferase
VSILLVPILGYLIGGLPTGIWVCRLVKGEDPRKYGSGSSGATNVARVLGKKWAAVVLVIDGLKGYLPVKFLVPVLASQDRIIVASLVMAASVVVGHVWTPFARFHGGKGVAAAAGGMLAIDSLSTLIAGGVWIVFFAAFHLVSLASVIAAVSLPVAMFVLGGRPVEYRGVAVLLALFIAFTHRTNIARLIRREEKPL